MMETEEEKCEGTELSIQIRDFTETATSYNLTVINVDSGYVVQRIIDEPWNGGNKIIHSLRPRSDYTVQVDSLVFIEQGIYLQLKYF